MPFLLGLAGGAAVGSPFVRTALFAGAAIFVFATLSVMQLDLRPGSDACPEGCEEDVGYGAVAIMVVSSAPVFGGAALGMLARSRLRR